MLREVAARSDLQPAGGALPHSRYFPNANANSRSLQDGGSACVCVCVWSDESLLLLLKYQFIRFHPPV